MNASEQLVSLIRELIREEMSKKDASSICQIASVNENGTVNIILPSDPDTIIPNIKNTSGYEFVSGDYGVLYKIENKLNNSFIFSKIITTPPVPQITKKDESTPSPPVVNNITYRIEPAPLDPTKPESQKVEYGFALVDTGDYAGYWRSQNVGVHNSYALCRIYFKGKGSLTLHCVSGGEPNYDFGIIGNINQNLSRSIAIDANVKHSFRVSGTQLITEDVNFEDINTNGEEWYIECKYRKDSGGTASVDSLYFKIITKFLVQQDDSVADYYVSKSDEDLLKIPFTIQQ